MEKARMSVTRAREFFLGAYHSLPNVLLVGSLILGTITGYLPMMWVSVGMILNGTITMMLQMLLKTIFAEQDWNTVSSARACEMFQNVSTEPNSSGKTAVFPSLWLSATTFFAVFSIYNSIWVNVKAPSESADPEKVGIRRAYTLSVIVIGVVFLGLILARGLSGCETWPGAIAGVLIGSGLAIGYYHILDACGTGSIPDLLQIVNALPPPGDTNNIPVVCTPPPAPTFPLAN